MAESTELMRRLALLEAQRIAVTSMTYFGAHLTIGRIDFLQDLPALEETRFMLAMGTKRRREFIAGRTAARRSLQRSGHQPAPILRGPGGAPIWPEGVSGSVTHNDRLAAAVVLTGRNSAPIGIDMEEHVPLPDDLVDLVLTQVERDTCSISRAGRANLSAKLFFSAKESVFKADWPRHGQFLNFGDVQITPIGEDVLIGSVVTETRRRNYLINTACSAETIVTLSRAYPPLEDS